MKSILVAGKPSEKNLDIAENEDYDLIVTGSTGMGAVDRVLLGA